MIKFAEAEQKEQNKKAADETLNETENEAADEALNETENEIENETENETESETENKAAEQYEYGGYQIRVHFSGEKTLVQCIKNLTEQKNICRYP